MTNIIFFFAIKYKKDLWSKFELKLNNTSHQICCRSALRKLNVQLNSFIWAGIISFMSWVFVCLLVIFFPMLTSL